MEKELVRCLASVLLVSAAVALELANSVRPFKGGINSLPVLENVVRIRPGDHQQRTRGDHRYQLLHVGVLKDSGNELALILRLIPVHSAHPMDLGEEIEGIIHRDCRHDPVVKRRRDPGVEATAIYASHPDPRCVHLFAQPQIFERALRFILGNAGLRQPNKQSFEMMVTFGAPLALADRISAKHDESQSRHVYAKCLSLAPAFPSFEWPLENRTAGAGACNPSGTYR